MNPSSLVVGNAKRNILKPESHCLTTGRLAFLILLSVAFAVVALKVSIRHGRLALPLTFDDIVYFLDAGQRLQIWHDHGVGGVFHGLATQPLRSPYSTFEAFFSFMIFGTHDWAPYVGNTFLIAGFLFLADRLTSGLQLWHRACLILLLMSFPLLVRAATTCRPDFAAALLTTAGVFSIAGRGRGRHCFVQSTIGRQARAGALFGLAILAKPSVFPATMATMCACSGAAALAFVLVNRTRALTAASRPVRAAVRACGICAASALLVAAPYFLVQGRATLQYIYDNILGQNADVWAIHVTFWQRVAFYVTGPGAAGNLNGHWFVLTIAIAASVIFYAGRRRPADLVTVAPVAAALAVAYAICTANRMKNDFLGLTFQVCLLYTLIAVLGCMVLSQRLQRQPPWAEALLVIVSLCGALGFKYPDRIGSPEDAAIRAQGAIIERLFDVTRSSARQTNLSAAPTRAFVAFTGRVNATLFNYFALKGRERIEFHDLNVNGDISRYLAELDRSDLVMLCDVDITQGLSRDEIGLVSNYVPNVGCRGPLLSAIQNRSDFTLLAQVEYPTNHRSFYVYRRNREHSRLLGRPLD